MNISLSADDVRRFADWSGDCNPLHIDPAAARATYFGQPVVHGMLSAIRALEATDLGRLTALDIEFRGALFPGDDSTLEVTEEDGRTALTMRSGEQVILIARTGTDRASIRDDPSFDPMASAATHPPRTAPADREVADLVPGTMVAGVYPAPGPWPLASPLRFPGLARILALASYTVGMELPGLRSVFTRATLSFHAPLPDAVPLRYRVEVIGFDPHFRMLEARLAVADPDGHALATATLRSYVRYTPVATPVEALRSRFGGRQSLAGKVALVTGGTRGAGADITAALAAAGCRVHASYRSDDAGAARFRQLLSDNGLDAGLLRGDAGDPEWCRQAVQRIEQEHGRLDVLVLNACAPPLSARLSTPPDEAVDYVGRNLRVARSPLAAALPVLARSGGAIVAISSSFVEDPPAGFADYVALKQAVESLTRSAVRESPGVSGIIARPPRLRTAWNDTPAAVPGTIASDRVASTLVEQLANGWAGGRVAVISEFPESPSDQAIPERDHEFTIALASTFTAEPLARGLRFWCRELAIDAGVDLAPYGQVLQFLVDPAAGAPRRGLNIVFLRVRDWLRELKADRRHSAEFVAGHLEETARDLERAFRAHRMNAAAETVLILCPSAAGVSNEPAIESLLDGCERTLFERLQPLPGLQVVSAAECHHDFGITPEEIADPLRETIAHIPYRDGYLYVLATLAMREAHRRMRHPRKVVVVDCDNTLWRGVVGEAGADGIELGPEHLALHERLAALGSSGMLVCLCSKNEDEDVWRVFETRPDVRLRRDQIVAAAINWQPKSENLRRLASRLNLGLDSFIFIDDNPVECAEVRAACPEVLTLEWPGDPEAAIRLLRHAWELQPGSTTAEDARRTEMYREELRRQELQDTLSFGEFLHTLGLVVAARALDTADLKRASQLTLRTNQFNFTTRRRDEGEMQALLESGRHVIRTVRVRDRFGDYGLVGLVIAEPQDDALVLDTFLLSCRVLGRGVEHQLAADLGRIALAAGLRTVRLRIDFTKRNTPAQKFLRGIVPDAYLVERDVSLECDIPAALLSEVRFDPGDGPGEALPETEPAATAASRVEAGPGLRAREAQIRRTAGQLATAADLLAAIGGQSRSPSGHAAESGIPDVVYRAFSSALGVPVSRIQETDSLEALGCDSFKIVEITVALIEQFPALPPTLLFEHRSVSEIVHEMEGLSTTAPDAGARAMPAADLVSPPHLDETDIAVIGMHARCAGANSPDELWDLLSQGRVAVNPVPSDRAVFLHALADNRRHWAGLLEDVERFDAELFGIAPREADVMDPQLRLFLEVAWGALEDAGCLGREHDPDTGVFAGVMYADYAPGANLAVRARELPYRSWESFSLANRLSQLLGFRGPSLSVDTACSSSATALHFACRALRAGDCNAAVVGGVNLILDPDRFVHLGRLGILSATGRCLAFGAEADGTVLGEGAGVVVLRRLSDARRRGDRILGVIKSTGVSTGSGTVGFTAPNPQAQAEAIRRALASARIDPRTIGYVETHGTGTLLGDPIEVRGLTLAHGLPELRDDSLEGETRCSLGSIKPNIGHLEAGAGVLGLIKILLQLQHRTLLPSVTSAEPNPQIPFSRTGFEIQRLRTPWTAPVFQRNGTPVHVPRRAALSSFGVGGANVHVIVEEAPRPETRDEERQPERPAHLLALSARTAEALRARAGQMAEWLAREPGVSVPDAFFSANTGRRQLDARAAMTAASREQALAALAQLAAGGPVGGVATGVVRRGQDRPRLAFLFTGQGSQHPRMGADLYETHPVFRDALDRCAAVFDTRLGRPLLRLLFAEPDTDDARLLNQTGFTQPALFAYEYALARLWESWGVRPDFVVGHSVGEIGAMCIAGGISLDDALRMIAARGTLMQALPPGGAMASVMADEARVLDALAGRENLSIAAINGPRQIVISGDGTALAEVVNELTAAGTKATRLTVSHAFHSPLMEPMVAAYSDVVRRIRFSVPQVPLVSGVHGGIAGEEIARAEYWIRNVLDPVRFTAGMATLARAGAGIFLEIGPQPIMAGMGRQCLPDHEGAHWIASARKDADAWTTILSAAGQLHVAGIDLDWKGFDKPWNRTRVRVPAYPFGGRRHWIVAPEGAVRPASLGAGLEAGDLAAGDGAPHATSAGGPQAYELVWTPEPAPVPPADASGHWIVFADREGRGIDFVRALEGLGGQCTVVFEGDSFASTGTTRYQIDPERPDTLDLLFRELAGRAPVRGVVSAWALDTGNSPDPPRAAHRLVEHAARLVRAASQGELRGNPPVWLVTSGALLLDGDPSSSVAQAALWGFGRTAALEHPEVWGGLIDLGTAPGASDAAAILAEVVGRPEDDQVAVRGGRRYAPRLSRLALAGGEPPRFDPEAAYLVTGGTGAIGRRVCRWLIERGARRVIVSSRRGAQAPGAAELKATIERLGGSVLVVAADVSREPDVDALLSPGDGTSRLGGIFHLAGVDESRPIAAMTSAGIAAVLRPKIDAAWLLHERSRVLPIEHFVLFSSISSLLGAAHRAHYAAGNAALDALAHERRRMGLPALVVNWGPWAGGGMATPDVLEQFERIGNMGLAPDRAIALLETALRTGRTQVAIADIDWTRFAPAYEARRRRPILSRVTAGDGAAAERQETRAPWLEALSRLAPEQREEELAHLLQQEVAETLGYEGPEAVSVDRPFQDLGMDSLMSAEFAQRIQKRLGTRSSALVFEHPRISALAGRLLAATDIAPAAAPVASQEVALASTGSASAALTVDVAAPASPIAGYSPQLEPLVYRFQEEAWPARRRDWIAPRWNWMFVESARRLGLEPRVWLYRENGRIAGHNGAIAVRVKIGEAERDTAWLVDTMVLEAYRSQAVGSRLMVRAHEDLPFALSLGQTQQMRDIQLRLGWEHVAPLETAQLLIRPERVLVGKLPPGAATAAALGLRAANSVRALKGRASLDVRQVDRFGDEHDRLWAAMAPTVTCAVRRDASYLNWKYVTQPGQEFIRLELSAAGRVRGVAVLMVRPPDSAYRYQRAFIVDIVAPLNDAALLGRIIQASVDAARRAGADAVNCLHIGAPLTAALKRAGFRLRNPERHLLVRAAGLDDDLRGPALSGSAWFVTQGDSDIDRPW